MLGSHWLVKLSIETSKIIPILSNCESTILIQMKISIILLFSIALITCDYYDGKLTTGETAPKIYSSKQYEIYRVWIWYPLLLRET